MSFLLPRFPDPSLRQPASVAALAPLLLSVYAQAVLAILPNTFRLKLALLPFIVWQAWSCAVGLNLSMLVAKWLGAENDERFRFWNVEFAIAMLIIATRSFEWTFIIKQPLRKYELQKGQDTPVERPLSIPNILLDALDLFFNQRGIGWSWSARAFRQPSESTPQLSIPQVWAKTLMKFTVLDTAQYILLLMSPSINKPGSGSIFDASLPFLPRPVSVMVATFWAGIFIYAKLECLYHIAMVIGRTFLRQPASHWPPFLRRPWMATSIGEFWSVRWHQFYRHFFVVFGARPGGAILGRPGAVMGAFAASGLMHVVGLWGAGRGTELRHDAGFFILMGLGVVLENLFTRATGLPVRGWYGWLWTMTWSLCWASLSFESWARRGIFAIDFFPDHLRPGKLFIDSVIFLFSKCK